MAQELTGLPEFRKHIGVTAFVEGWALYTERLADEMGLYSGTLDRLGMLELRRLARRAGWSSTPACTPRAGAAQQAIDYMDANTALAHNNVVNEVDRYIGWPAQALAYKIGQREILPLRAEAERRLGARFDIRAFHDVVLGSGAVSLPVLREQISSWLEDVVR